MSAEFRLVQLADIDAGERSRSEYRNIRSLARSIKERGLISPIYVRPIDGGRYRLVCGGRRLAAVESLGQKSIMAHVAADDLDELGALYAEADENTEREPFSVAEAVRHRRRIESVERRLAKNRQRASGGANPGSAKLAEPAHERTTRTRTARATGFGHTTLDKADKIISVAEDPATPEPVREVAQSAAANLAQHGAKVDAEKRKVDEALARFIEGDASINAAKYRLAFIKHLRKFELGSWEPDRVAEVADAELIESIDIVFAGMARWHQQFTEARRPLRLMNGGGK